MEKYFRWFGWPGAVVLTSLMSALALLLAITNPSPVRWICFAAMALSSVGDVFLAHLKVLNQKFKNCFTIGAVFFMASHLMYVLCYGMKLHQTGGSLLNPGAIAAGVIGLAALILMLTLSFKTGRRQRLTLIVVYLMIILSNCAVAFAYAWAKGFCFSAVCAAVGVLSFLLSDLVIGLNLAGDIHRFDFLIWWLYPVGQVLLILGV